MNIQHHPLDETLASYAAGALPAALALVVGCHLSQCGHCRQILASLEAVGGALIEQLPPKPLPDSARDAVLARLDQVGAAVKSAPVESAASRGTGLSIPPLLKRLLGTDDYSALPWRSIGPAAKLLKLACEEGTLIMLKVAAGRAMPVHSHRGNELTLILQGGYHDKLGSFNAGDFADLDGSTEHQPVAFEDEDCICLAGLDDKLRFPGWIPRLLQPFTGI